MCLQARALFGLAGRLLPPTPTPHTPRADPKPSQNSNPRPAEGDTLFEWVVDDATGEWRHWSGAVPAWAYPVKEERPKFAQLVIPTLDSVR